MDNNISDHASAYDFVQLGEKLADALVQTAEDQVTKAQQILDQTRAMAAILRDQVAAQTKQIEEMTGRFKAFGEQMIEANHKLNGDDVASSTIQRPASDVVKLRTLAHDIGVDIPVATLTRAAPRSDNPASRGHELYAPKRNAKNGDGSDELRRPLAPGQPHAPWAGRGDTGAQHPAARDTDNGTGSRDGEGHRTSTTGPSRETS